MSKKRDAAPRFNYPPALRSEGGCKVGWLYYATREEAEAASKVAKAEGGYKADLGYDFGYSAPGNIEKCGDEFRVTRP